MEPIKSHLTLITSFIAGAIGMLVFSSAMSSARWNEFNSTAVNHNDLGWLVALGGVAILMLMIGNVGLFSRIRALEKRDSNSQR